MNQAEIVLSYLKAGKHLTTMQAYEELRITRLPSRICELRKAGYRIGSVRRTCVNKLENVSNYCEYFLIDEGEK